MHMNIKIFLRFATYLKKTWCARQSVRHRPKFIWIMDCPICYESLEVGETRTTCCNHTFHRACLRRWVKTKKHIGTVSCPMCRTTLQKPPPALEEPLPPQTSIAPLPVRINCTGITKRGTQCKFKARVGDTRCGHHLTQPPNIFDAIWLVIASDVWRIQVE
jgi:uncharacterized protein YbaR (Trm112 family)